MTTIEFLMVTSQVTSSTKLLIRVYNSLRLNFYITQSLCLCFRVFNIPRLFLLPLYPNSGPMQLFELVSTANYFGDLSDLIMGTLVSISYCNNETCPAANQ